jgi:hypothetical protein
MHCYHFDQVVDPIESQPVMDPVAYSADHGLGLGDEGAALLHQVLGGRVVVALDGGSHSNLAICGQSYKTFYSRNLRIFVIS